MKMTNNVLVRCQDCGEPTIDTEETDYELRSEVDYYEYECPNCGGINELSHEDRVFLQKRVEARDVFIAKMENGSEIHFSNTSGRLRGVSSSPPLTLSPSSPSEELEQARELAENLWDDFNIYGGAFMRIGENGRPRRVDPKSVTMTLEDPDVEEVEMTRESLKTEFEMTLGVDLDEETEGDDRSLSEILDDIEELAEELRVADELGTEFVDEPATKDCSDVAERIDEILEEMDDE